MAAINQTSKHPINSCQSVQTLSVSCLKNSVTFASTSFLLLWSLNDGINDWVSDCWGFKTNNIKCLLHARFFQQWRQLLLGNLAIIVLIHQSELLTNHRQLHHFFFSWKREVFDDNLNVWYEKKVVFFNKKKIEGARGLKWFALVALVALVGSWGVVNLVCSGNWREGIGIDR